jgi:hypothetical protein
MSDQTLTVSESQLQMANPRGKEAENYPEHLSSYSGAKLGLLENCIIYCLDELLIHPLSVAEPGANSSSKREKVAWKMGNKTWKQQHSNYVTFLFLFPQECH